MGRAVWSGNASDLWLRPLTGGWARADSLSKGGGSRVRTVILLVPVTARCGRHPRACFLLEVARHCQGHEYETLSSEEQRRAGGGRREQAGGGRREAVAWEADRRLQAIGYESGRLLDPLSAIGYPAI